MQAQRKGLLLLAPLFTICLAGCSAGMDPQNAEGDGDESVTRTIVHLRGDQAPEVITERISSEEAAAEVAARAAGNLHAHPASGAAATRTSVRGSSEIVQTAQAIRSDSGCAGSSLWIHDATGQAGNRLCVYGSGKLYLGNICRVWGTVCLPGRPCAPGCTSTWSSAVRSYWAGADDTGAFTQDVYPENPTVAPRCYEHFRAWNRVDTAATCARVSNYVCLDCWRVL